METPVVPEETNTNAVRALYAALAQGNTKSAAELLAADLEWWFHGPPRCQYMMRVLTGESTHMDFGFDPQSITAIGNKVFVEGWEGSSVYWVHVWSLKDGVITQVREYFNTWLTVRDLRSPPVYKAAQGHETRTLWQSEPGERLNRSLPSLVLAI